MNSQATRPGVIAVCWLDAEFWPLGRLKSDKPQ